MSDAEQWCVVPGYPDYQVSNLGAVMSYRRGAGRLLSARPTSAATNPKNLPYLYVALYGAAGQRAERTVHSLVLEAFVGPRPEGAEVRHLNNDPQDNRLENLAWGTKDENTQDKIDSRPECRNGHPLGGWSKNGAKRRRSCNTCRREAYSAAR